MPILGRSASIYKGATEIGYCTSVSVSIDVDLIKEYYISGSSPGQAGVSRQRKQELQG
jgi:hypothetical protein